MQSDGNFVVYTIKDNKAYLDNDGILSVGNKDKIYWKSG